MQFLPPNCEQSCHLNFQDLSIPDYAIPEFLKIPMTLDNESILFLDVFDEYNKNGAKIKSHEESPSSNNSKNDLMLPATPQFNNNTSNLSKEMIIPVVVDKIHANFDINIAEDFIYIEKSSKVESIIANGVVSAMISSNLIKLKDTVINEELSLDLVINDTKNSVINLSLNKLFISTPISQPSPSVKLAHVLLKSNISKYSEVLPLLRYQIPPAHVPMLMKARSVLTRTSELQDKLVVQIALNPIVLSSSSSIKLTDITIQISLTELASANSININTVIIRGVGKYNDQKSFITWNLENINISTTSKSPNILEVEAEISYKDRKQQQVPTFPIIVKCFANDFVLSASDININFNNTDKCVDLKIGKVLKRSKLEYRFL